MDALSLLSVAGPTALVTAGAVWGGFKGTLNGTKERVAKLEQKADDHTDRLARIETKLDTLIKRD